MRRLGLALAVLLAGAGCRGRGLDAADEVAGRQLDAAGQSHCSVVKDPNKPLIVEWSGMDAAELEARLLRGVVAVRYENCEMEVLPACAPPGAYAYGATTTGRQNLHIGSLDDLLINIPLGLAELGGRVERGEALDLGLVVVGRYEAPRLDYTAADLPGGPECSRATHVVTGVSLGAFRLTASQDTLRRGGVRGAVGGGSVDRIEVVKESPPGMLEACAQIGGGDDARRAACTAPIRLEVTPLVASSAPPGTLVPPELRAGPAMDTSGSLVAHQAHEAALRAQRDPASTPERTLEAWCFLASIAEQNPYLELAHQQCARWRDYAGALRSAEARMIRDYEALRLLLELRSVAVSVQERAAATFLDAHAGLSAEHYPRVRAVERARHKLGRGQRASLPNFGVAHADESPHREAAAKVGSVDRRTYRKAISVGLLSRWIPTGAAFGARVLGRVNFVHEIGFEVGYVQYAAFGGPRWRHVLALAGYERVFRPDRLVRPSVGASVGAMIPVGPRCVGDFQCTSPAGVGLVNGGVRVSITPWFSLVAQGFVGGLTTAPYLSAGLGGGLEFTIPGGRDWPQ